MANRETEYDEANWIHTYANVLGRLGPDLGADEAQRLAREIIARAGRWKDPTIAAWGDAMYGPLLVV